MSRAFVKEDSEQIERTTRRRAASGLPPAARNYMTARGARRLRHEAAGLRASGNEGAATEIERAIAGATVVEPPSPTPDFVFFGSVVTLRGADGAESILRIVGVDELGLDENAVSWVSPVGKALLGTELRRKTTLGPGGPAVTVIKVESPELG